MMQAKAKDEGTGFSVSFKEDFQKACLLYDHKSFEYLGFVVFKIDTEAVLQQIYIVKEHRKKGYGSKLLDYWAKNYALKINKIFYVEKPTDITRVILKNNGYEAEKSENKVIGLKCRFIGRFYR